MLALLLACSGGDPADTATTSDTAGQPDFDGDWAWCPSAGDAVTSGPAELTVTEGALYCALGSGAGWGTGGEGGLAGELARHVQVRVVPGTYALPTGDGATVDYALPVCLDANDGVPSARAGMGTMAVHVSDFPYTSWGLDAQPLSRGEEAWTFGFGLTAYPQDAGLPELVFDESLVHGDYPDTEARLQVCRGDCETDLRYVYPCDARAPQDDPTMTVTFDRGTFASWVEEVYGTWGPSVPAVYYRAEGTLDGVAFAVTDYWDLAHLPDHHNRGGGFLARFAEPIGSACGLLAEVPSEDGSYRFERLRAATIDCDGNVLEELDGVAFTEGPRR